MDWADNVPEKMTVRVPESVACKICCFQGVREDAEDGEYNAKRRMSAILPMAFRRVLLNAWKIRRQVKRHGDQMEEKEVTGKVEYFKRLPMLLAWLLPYSTKSSEPVYLCILWAALMQCQPMLMVLNVPGTVICCHCCFIVCFLLVCFFVAVLVAGSNGQVETSYLRKLKLRPNHMKKYPLPLIKLMTRYAEDLIWANKIKNGVAIFKFLLQLTEERTDSSEFRKG